MFNTYVTQQKVKEYVPYDKTVTEVKAPTDESIKLLNEWKDKLMEQIVGVYRTEDCPINMVSVISKNPNTMGTLMAIKTTINGEDKYYNYKINEEQLLTSSLTEILQERFEEIVKENVADLVRDLLVKTVVSRKLP